jgi:hypothetical protein
MVLGVKFHKWANFPWFFPKNYVRHLTMFLCSTFCFYVWANFALFLCSTSYDVWKCLSNWGVCTCSSYCDVTMHGRWQHYEVRHITMFGNVFHIATSIFVRHIATLRCLVHCKFTIFDTLLCLKVFATLRCQDMCVTLQREEIFSIL